VTGFTGLLFHPIAGVEKEDLPHHGLGKFLELRRVAGLAYLTAYVCGLLSSPTLRGPTGFGECQEQDQKQNGRKKLFHIPPALQVAQNPIVSLFCP
jgi:hypothetical protein